MRCLSYIYLFTCVSTLSYAVEEANKTLASPEEEIQLSLTRLANLEKRVEAATKLNSSRSLSPYKASANKAFSNAVVLFKNTEYLATIRELNTYLNLTQVPETKPYLQAQFMLGRSYEEIGLLYRSFKAYLRYIATFITYQNKDYAQFMEVMHRIMPLAAKHSATSNKEIRKTFSSLMSLKLPKEQEAEIHYISATVAKDVLNKDVALEWFERASSSTETRAIKSRSHYFKALLALGKKDYQQAENLLKEGLIVSDKTSQEMRDLANLTLARIAIHQKKPELALIHYERISEGSHVYKDALFESSYVFLNQNEGEAAAKQAAEYLRRFPDGHQALQLRTLLAYLHLEAGSLKRASSQIKDNKLHFKDLASWLEKSYRYKDRLSHADIHNLYHRTRNMIPASEQVQQAYKLFGMLAELKRRLADVRGNIQNLLYTIGRVTVAQFRPQWINQSKQLASLSEESLLTGHRLVASLKGLLKGKLSDIERHGLEASQKRRMLLLSQPAKYKRMQETWKTWANINNLTHDVARKYAELKVMQAQISAMSYHLKENPKQENSDLYQDDLAHLGKKASQLEKSLARAIELLRGQKITNFLKQSSHRSSMKFHLQYANLLHEEIDLLNRHLGETQKPSQKFLADDAKRALRRWEHVNAKTYQAFSTLNQKMKEDLRSLLAELDRLTARHDELEAKARQITDQLEVYLGNHLSMIVGYYERQIDELSAKHQKWEADLAWLEFNRANDQKDALEGQHKLEKQILKDNLRDLQQGVLRRWPQ